MLIFLRDGILTFLGDRLHGTANIDNDPPATPVTSRTSPNKSPKTAPPANTVQSTGQTYNVIV